MMKKLLYIIFMSFTLIGCTSNEKEVLDNAQFYTTDDLVEIASEYGFKFQPQKEAVGIAFVSIMNQLDGMAASDEIDSESKDDISFTLG